MATSAVVYEVLGKIVSIFVEPSTISRFRLHPRYERVCYMQDMLDHRHALEKIFEFRKNTGRSLLNDLQYLTLINHRRQFILY